MGKNKFDNKNRNRYYGLRIGDIVEVKTLSGTILKCKVIAYGFMDNNRVHLRKLWSRKVFSWTAEGCKIIKFKGGKS